jgi:predicted DNA-binding transcriptional regulator AlpA
MSTTLAPVERTYSRAAAAERLGLSRATLARWAVQGRGPRYSRTGDVRGKAIYREADLIAWLESRKQQATAGASHGTR